MKRLASLVLAAITVTAAAASSHAAIPKPDFPILIWNSGTGNGCYLYTADMQRRGPLGGGPSFQNQTGRAHIVGDRAGTFAVRVNPDATKYVDTHAAGTYVATCDGHNGSVVYKTRVTAPSKPSSASFPVTWADSSAGGTWRYDVRYKVPNGSWRTWKHNTSVRSHTFPGMSGRTYYFEAQTTGPGGTTQWSPPTKVTA